VPEVKDGDPKPMLGFIWKFFAGTVVDSLVDVAAGALLEAAAADKDGLGVPGNDARYLYYVQKDGQNNAVASHASCLIVAVAKVNNDVPHRWCIERGAERNRRNDIRNPPADVGAAFDKPCKNGMSILKTLNEDRLDRFPADDGNARELPALYAEIALYESSDKKAVRPELVNLYYPAALQRRSGVTRDLKISAQLRLPDQDKGSAVLVMLRGITPGPKGVDAKTGLYSADTLRSQGYLWTNAAAYAATSEYLATRMGYRVGPINVFSEVRETGDINRFLQALAKNFDKNKGELAKGIKGELFPPDSSVAQQAKADLAVAIEELVAAAEKAESALVAACFRPIGSNGFPNREVAITERDQLIASLRAARMKANAKGASADPKVQSFDAASLTPSCPTGSPGAGGW
jgi:hypothetical protein